MALLYALFLLIAAAVAYQAATAFARWAGRRRRVGPAIRRNLEDHFPDLAVALSASRCRAMRGALRRYEDAVARAVAGGRPAASVSRTAPFAAFLPDDLLARIAREDLTWRRLVQAIRNGGLQAGGVPYRWFVDHDGHLVQAPIDPDAPEPRPYITA